MATKTKTALSLEESTEDQALQGSVEDSGDWGTDEGAEPEGLPVCEVSPSETPEAVAPIEHPARLTGEELLSFYSEKKDAGRTHAQIAYDAGYFTTTKSGQERVMQAQFNEAFLEAQGIETGSESASSGRAHAGLSKARVSGQGILLVSQLATRHVLANPGDVFEVSYPGEGQILLRPTGEVKPVVPRKGKVAEEPGAPLLDQAA
jgi:hypothetical protein